MTLRIMKTAAPRRLGVLLVLITLALAPPAVLAKRDSGPEPTTQRYIVELADPPVAAYDGRELPDLQGSGFTRMRATSPDFTGALRLRTDTAESLEYIDFLAGRQQAFESTAESLLGRQLRAVHRYRLATNGLALDLTPEEAAELRQAPGVKSISEDVRYRLETFAGPPWIGSEAIWNGASGFPPSRSFPPARNCNPCPVPDRPS